MMNYQNLQWPQWQTALLRIGNLPPYVLDRLFDSFSDESLSDLTRFNKIAISNNKSQMAVDKEAIGLSRVQQFSHLCVARPYQISVNSIFKHIHTTSINTIIWQFVPFIYHPL